MIRPATAADSSAIIALEQLIFPRDAWSPELFAAELQAPYRSYYVAVDSATGGICGYAGVLQLGTEADVQTIAVHPAQQGQGIGAALLQQLGATATAQGAQQIFLEVRADNEPALRLYRRHGFSELGVRPKYYQPDGVDAITMRARLPLTLNDDAKQRRNTADA